MQHFTLRTMGSLSYLSLILVISIIPSQSETVAAKNTNITQAKEWLKEYDELATAIYYKGSLAAWAYNTNITEFNRKKSVELDVEEAAFTKEAAKNATSFDFKNFNDESVKRQFESVAEQGTDAMRNTKKLERLSSVVSEMEGIYSKGKVCGIPNEDCLALEPGLTRLMADSEDSDLLAFIWKRWRKVSKGEMKDQYKEFVELSNEGVQDGGWNDTGEYWRSWYESATFEKDLQNLLDELKPLYENLHAYVRRKLKEKFTKASFPTSGHIPAHLLGNMWAQSWINVYDYVIPFENKTSIDVTPVLRERNFNATMMFRTAEEFFTSLGLKGMPDEFWNNSMIVRPADGREVVCHASAWDFNHGNDVRIKMCTDITMDDLITIHHEMGHIQYFLQYQKEPVTFRGGANPGFHEAIGDVLALSVSTPKHLHAIGLLDKVENDNEADINYLMLMALDKISFLPFGYLIDQWRWSVFRGDTLPDEYNNDWWDLRCKYQGISPPVKRTSEDFDAGAKYHIPANTPYIRYFVSFVIQFQFHKSLCEAANQTGPLHQCDIYQSKEAGTKLAEALKLGSSLPWPDVMERITGTRSMNASAILEYFKPLVDWLTEQNKGHATSWDKDACPKVEDEIEEEMAKRWLNGYNEEAEKMRYKMTISQWNYGSNITDYNQQVMVNTSLESSEFDKKMAAIANSFPWQSFTDADTKRQFQKITNIGTSALKDKDQLKEMAELQAHIEGIYGKATVVMSDGKVAALEPELTHIIASSRNFSELREVWVKWRDASGKKMRTDYAKFVNISNRAVQQLGYADTGEYWRSVYETDTFQTDLSDLLDNLKPLYGLLHGYVRRELKKQYGAENFPVSGHIPAHLLGNMWAQHWNNIYDLVQPFKGKEKIDVTPEMIKQGYNVTYMFRTAEEFFKSLNLTEMPESFWNKTIMIKPDGITMVCHASAWDFYNQKDFRIKMCTDVNMENLGVIHHEMGHIQYFLQYKNQPVIYREGANPGFHEAIGDVMTLSFSTPKHLHAIGLIDNVVEDDENDINFLLKMALDKVAFLPFGYLIDQWRWSVFSGETPPTKYNEKWWDLRCKYQGIAPPVGRTEDDFDPGAKYHIPANVPYIRYFVSYVIQFQFHKSLCEAAGHTGPLHKCDIYKSTKAGEKLGELLRLGSSKPWTEAMTGLTGNDKMDVHALLEYFQPLIDWLKTKVPEDERTWQESCDMETVEDQARHWLDEYEVVAQKAFYEESEIEWTFNTNITKENEAAVTNASLKLAAFQKEAAKNASRFDWKSFKDESLHRQFNSITNIGSSAMEDQDELKRLSNVQSEMESIYSTAKVCTSPDDCKALDPGLSEIMSKSRDYDELLDAWKSWRDVSGKLMPKKYAEFVALSNKALAASGYKDTGEYWRAPYESDSFEQDIQDLLEQLKPLYQNLHTYIRRELVKKYGASRFPQSGHIPAHLLGNMWAQQWNNIYDIVVPFKGKQNIDVSNTLVKRGYNATMLFKTAEDFFTSLGLKQMPQPFWDKSMKVRPKGRDVVCHASAWDFYNRKDYRIKMCTNINMEDMITIHHEMGHIQYDLQYAQQPISFRSGANPGFHEAVGDVMALSVSTPKHLRKIGLLEQGDDDEESEINFLLKMALEKIAFLPFGYLIDQWRWSVFRGETTPEKYNEKWWELRCKYQGISPPVERGESDFDPGAKFHIPSNYPYIRYFVSYVVQFQFHQAACRAANQTGPLHRCDIYQSKSAGKLLSDMLSMGASKPWPEAMEVMTGQRKMDAGPLMEYFKPLNDWLEKEIAHERPGWSSACPTELSSPPVHVVKFSQTIHDHGPENAASFSVVISGINVALLVSSFLFSAFF